MTAGSQQRFFFFVGMEIPETRHTTAHAICMCLSSCYIIIADTMVYQFSKRKAIN